MTGSPIIQSCPVVLVSRRHATYDDVPGLRYHFPRGLYESFVRAAEGQVGLIYEPRRGGTSATSSGGGRQAFIAWAVLGPIEPDRERLDHAYVRFLEYQELTIPVYPSEVGVKAKAFPRGVLPIDYALVETVLRTGMAPLLYAAQEAVGLVERGLPFDPGGRLVREVVRYELVRDRAFRYKVIEQAYEGRCAMSGLRLTNGFGRAEVDAAHIRPVERGGPDIVSNGLALTKTLHWAFDRGLVSATDDGRILTVERGMPIELQRILRPDRLLTRPKLPLLRPHPAFLSWHRSHVFKGDPSVPGPSLE
jgi:putative restriction endonuclease